MEIAATFEILRDRFFAWWNGYEFRTKPKVERKVVVDEDEDDEVIPEPSGRAEWTPERIRALQMIFGPGEDSPLASERCKQLITPRADTPLRWRC